ncbi:MAG: hypothetical protein HRU51_02200, partial [Xanthomonadales bacterium]|nr:hypothetical protein [Xanthomonadales bacterium]
MLKLAPAALAAAVCSALISGAAAQANEVSDLSELGATQTEDRSTPLPVGKTQRVSTTLMALYDTHHTGGKSTSQGVTSNDSSAGMLPEGLSAPEPRVFDGGYVIIDAVAQSDAASLQAELEAMGMKQGASFGRMVSGLFPIARLGELESMVGLNSVQASMAMTARGSVQSQGDRAQNSQKARSKTKARGRGIDVGVISDSYDCLGGAASGIASKDLPKAK